jgi:hypothetical protein
MERKWTKLVKNKFFLNYAPKNNRNRIFNTPSGGAGRFVEV